MNEGTRLHALYQGKQGSDYISEYPLKRNFTVEEVVVTLEGRADGIIKRKNGDYVIDEIKTTIVPLEEFKNDKDRLDILKEVIEDFTGYPVVIERDGDGYIDHQSVGTLTISRSREEVKDFIFNQTNNPMIENKDFS